jgi:hypothetical protein
VEGIAEVYEREVRDLPCFENRTRVIVELYRVRCPGCGIKTEKVPKLLEAHRLKGGGLRPGARN